ncbi:MAG TPA: sugar phosphate isomerase/epimerase family protein [Terriglobia bacterium]|nr:sugar phosphate isomerase/epimerase family protein [Terriglobia bacterium]
MKYGLSTRLFSVEYLGSALLDRIIEAGFREIEICAAREHLDYHDAQRVRDVGLWFSDRGVALHSLHAPPCSESGSGRRGGLVVSIAHLERRHRIASMDEIKRVLEVAERLPYRYLVLHVGLDDEEYSLEKFDAAFTSLEHLRIFAKERGVRLLLENTANGLGTPARLIDFLQYTRLDDVGICFDAGHAHLGGALTESLKLLQARMACAHLHDNDGEKDDHRLPFEGGIDWAQFLPDLASAAGAIDGFCAFLELRERAAEPVTLQEIRTAARKLEALEREPAEEIRD